MSSSIVDIFLVSIFVLGALIYLGFRLRKKIRALRDSRNASGCCGCATECSSKREIPLHLRKK